MRFPLLAVVTAVASLWLIAVAHADDAADVKQQLALLSAEIKQLDGKVTEIGKQRTELEVAIDQFAGRLSKNNAEGRRVAEFNAKLTSQSRQLTSEEHAAAELCSRKVSEHEYKALLAQCESAHASYQQHVNTIHQDYDKATEEYAGYQNSSKSLEAERKDLDQRRQNIQQAQSTLHTEHERLATQFNELRDRLIKLQAKSD